MKLSRSQYIATSINKYGPYINNMFVLEDFAPNFHRQFINVINSNPPLPSLTELR